MGISQQNYVLAEKQTVYLPDDLLLQARPIFVGTHVRVKPSVVDPIDGWGRLGVTHSSVGIVRRLYGDGERCMVDFPDHMNWYGMVPEMEAMIEAEEPAEVIAQIVSIPVTAQESQISEPSGNTADNEKWVRPADDLEGEWSAVARSIFGEETELLLEMRRTIEAAGLDDHPACSLMPHTRRASTLLRFLRARQGDVEKALALLQGALDWRQEFKLDARLKEWRSEWDAGTSPRAKLIKEYDYVGCLCTDSVGLPVYVYRHCQGDLAGLVREVGEDHMLLHLLRTYEDSLEEARQLTLRTGRFICSFVEIHDTGNYGFVPNYLSRAFGAASIYKRYAPVFDKVYPERLRVCIMLRAPTVFSAIWRIIKPVIPEATRQKIHFKTTAKGNESWGEEIEALLPRNILPNWMCSDDQECLRQAKPWGGVVPLGAGK